VGRVVKQHLASIVSAYNSPLKERIYEGENALDSYRKSAVAPNGDLYIADGYGSQLLFAIRIRMGLLIRKFGGTGTAMLQFKNCPWASHRFSRGGKVSTLLCTLKKVIILQEILTMERGIYLDDHFSLAGAFCMSACDP